MATKKVSKGTKAGGGSKSKKKAGGSKATKRAGVSRAAKGKTTPLADSTVPFTICIRRCFEELERCFRSGTDPSVCARRAEACVRICFKNPK